MKYTRSQEFLAEAVATGVMLVLIIFFFHSVTSTKIIYNDIYISILKKISI